MKPVPLYQFTDKTPKFQLSQHKAVALLIGVVGLLLIGVTLGDGFSGSAPVSSSPASNPVTLLQPASGNSTASTLIIIDQNSTGQAETGEAARLNALPSSTGTYLRSLLKLQTQGEIVPHVPGYASRIEPAKTGQQH